jgi:HAD superfamily hydrolase (TIGR01484 family)
VNKKIIFFDADGTIIKGSNMSPLTVEAFRKLKKNGHILVLSTGRAIPAIDGILKEMNFGNMICSGGGTVLIGDKIVYSRPMSKESKKELLDYFDKRNVLYNLESNDYIYIKKGYKEKYLRLFQLPDKETVTQRIIINIKLY